ncbi:MAG: hypothetical protein ACT4O0_05200 [Pseudonocardia sp.]
MFRTDSLSIELGPNYDDSYEPSAYDEHAGPVPALAGGADADLIPPF